MTMIKIFFYLIMILLSSCRFFDQSPATDSKLSKVKVGMDYLEMVNIIGTPDTIIHLGIMLDQYGSQTKTDEWWYGKNTVIVMVNDTVNAIDANAIETEKRIQHIIDSARATDGAINSFIQPSGN